MSLFAVCRVDDIPNQRARGFVLMRPGADGGEVPWPIFILRWGRHLLGFENACPHEGGRLDWERDNFLDGSGTRITCGKHGALFDFATGICVEGPCRNRQLTRIEVVVDDGDVCVTGVELLDGGEVEEAEAESAPEKGTA